MVADIDGQGNVLVSYVWGEGIDRLLAVKLGEATYYPLTDVQGTVWGYVDSQNNIVARWQYDAWGNVVEESVSVPALATLRYRFQGREWSAATGLVNFRMRWYDSETGRWLSKDPIGLSGGLNLYAFCMDSPIGIIDPMGNDAYISGSSGHAAMWVDEPGENGKVAIFDFGPATGGWNDYNRNLIYGKGKTVVTRSNKKDSMGRYDVRIVTSEATDRAIIDCMEQYKKEDHDYSFLFNNYAQAVRAVLIRSGVDDIGWCVWPEGLVESIRKRGGSYEPYNVFSHNPYFCPLR
ncbi:MAG: hypothetical protein IKL96_04280 [Kiritimatiellae bacterium]|nr:hypothetical protein [Kiritimatiellia bacterium]